MKETESLDQDEFSPAAYHPPSVVVESITFSDGTTLTLDPGDIVVLVGPNNSGKSAALREIEQSVGGSARGVVLRSAKLRRSGTLDDLRTLLDLHSRKVGTVREAYRGFRYSVRLDAIENHWRGELGPLRQVFCSRISTESRIVDSNPASAIPLLTDPPQHPIHMLYADDGIESRISNYFRRAFGEELTVFRLGGSSWPLLVGPRPFASNGEDRISISFAERLRNSTVPLENQGDGMRSFASVILHLLAPSTQTILLLDEPEAFLHPPQARLLGEFIAKEKPADAQLFIATHSPDVLQGLLNVASKHLRVVRIQRQGSVNRVKELDKARAIEISTDPLMKYSSVMSGIFHQRVIICESDADCMFYGAVLDLQSVHGSLQPDVLFVQAGGKQRAAALAEALRALDVTVDVVVDIDILNDESVFERLVTAMGGDFASISAESRPLKTAIEQKKPWLNSGEIAKGIRSILDQAPEAGEFPKALKARVDAIFRKASPWDAIKDAGQAAIPAGQPTIHWQALRQLVNKIGIWIVPVGELEGFCKAVGGHGPRWAQEVIETRDLATDPDLQAARDFLKEIWARVPSVSM